MMTEAVPRAALARRRRRAATPPHRSGGRALWPRPSSCRARRRGSAGSREPLGGRRRGCAEAQAELHGCDLLAARRRGRPRPVTARAAALEAAARGCVALEDGPPRSGAPTRGASRGPRLRGAPRTPSARARAPSALPDSSSALARSSRARVGDAAARRRGGRPDGGSLTRRATSRRRSGASARRRRRLRRWRCSTLSRNP